MRFSPRLPQKSVQIFHLPSTAGASQAYPSTADLTINALVLPINRGELAMEGVDVVEGWELYVDPTTDIRYNDKVIIAGDTANFYVAKIFTATFGVLQHKRVSVRKQI